MAIPTAYIYRRFRARDGIQDAAADLCLAVAMLDLKHFFFFLTFRSLLVAQQVKDLALLGMWFRLLLWLTPGPGTSCCRHRGGKKVLKFLSCIYEVMRNEKDQRMHGSRISIL